MNEIKYEISEVGSNSEWDSFLLKSENQNIYSSSEFIVNSKKSFKKFFIKKNEEIFASFNLCVENNMINLGDRIYTPLNFKFFDKQNPSSVKYKKFEIINEYAKFIKKNFNSGEICFDRSTNDLRPFNWLNFEEKKKIFFVKEVKYTTIIKLKNYEILNSYDEIINSKSYKNFSRSLKQQINKSTDSKLEFEENYDEIFFQNTLERTFNNQGKKIDTDIILLKKIYNELYKNKKLYMFINSDTNKKLSYCIFGVIGKNAIYLNGGRVNNTNDDVSLSHNLIMSLSELKKKGVEIVDLEGVNSPKRGFWKLGFGGEIKPYYHISFKS